MPEPTMKIATYITPGEFELMEILWPLGKASVKEVWERIDPQRDLAYTTVMTVMDKMCRKGFLSHSKKGRAYIYSPTIRREQALAAVVEHLASSYFNGSTDELLVFVKGLEKPQQQSSERRI